MRRELCALCESVLFVLRFNGNTRRSMSPQRSKGFLISPNCLRQQHNLDNTQLIINALLIHSQVTETAGGTHAHTRARTHTYGTLMKRLGARGQNVSNGTLSTSHQFTAAEAGKLNTGNTAATKYTWTSKRRTLAGSFSIGLARALRCSRWCGGVGVEEHQLDRPPPPPPVPRPQDYHIHTSSTATRVPPSPAHVHATPFIGTQETNICQLLTPACARVLTYMQPWFN